MSFSSDTKQELNNIKNQKQIGDKVKIKVYRSGEYKEGDVTLGSDENVNTDTATN